MPDFDRVFYFQDSSWTYSGFSQGGNGDLFHTGCGNNSCFFMGINLYHFNRNSNPILIRENIEYICADIAVDENENSWILTGEEWLNSDTLRIVDSTGISSCDLPFKVPTSTFNAYGMAIWNNSLIVGFGPLNKLYPNSIVPVVIDTVTNTVEFGEPIVTNAEITGNLASCSKTIQIPNCNISTSSVEIDQSPNVQFYPIIPQFTKLIFMIA